MDGATAGRLAGATVVGIHRVASNGKKGKGRWVKIPVGAPLKTMLERTQRVATVILTTSNDTAWTEDGFRASWGRACTKADIPDDLTFHDIRGSAGTRLAGASCEVPEIATITGRSLNG